MLRQVSHQVRAPVVDTEQDHSIWEEKWPTAPSAGERPDSVTMKRLQSLVAATVQRHLMDKRPPWLRSEMPRQPRSFPPETSSGHAKKPRFPSCLGTTVPGDGVHHLQNTRLPKERARAVPVRCTHSRPDLATTGSNPVKCFGTPMHPFHLFFG